MAGIQGAALVNAMLLRIADPTCLRSRIERDISFGRYIPMPDNIASLIMLLLFLGIHALAFFSVIKNAIKNKCAPVKTVKAVVIDKHILEPLSKYSGNGKHEKYVVVFSAEGKKLSFYVSRFSYDGYRLNEKGSLTFKGDRIIEFG
ncbi:MAG: DUF2500 family protein [Faecousia sp.]